MATRGRRNPDLLKSVRQDVAAVVTYVCGPRKLKFGEYELVEGVEVPGAQSWTRVDAWVSARSIRPLQPGEDFVPFDEFRAPIDLERGEARLEHLYTTLGPLEQAVETAEVGARKAMDSGDSLALEEALALQLEATNALERARQAIEAAEEAFVETAQLVGALPGEE